LLNRKWVPDALGVAWTLLAAVVVLAPALRPGVSLGPFDLLSRFGLTSQHGVHVHNAMQSDQILLFIPMTNVAWHQVHSGHLPLWNSYNVLGTPLAFNWESAVFSLPMLVAYLFPVSFAFTALVLVKLLIAGSGAYVLCRVLGMGPMPSALGGTVFELSGSIVHYSGWSIVGVECWTGWVFAGAILVARKRPRMRDVIGFAVAIGFAVYGGYPAGLVLLAIALAIFLAVHLFYKSSEAKTHALDAGTDRAGGLDAERPSERRAGTGLRGLLRVVVVGACGLALGAPLLLPGTQLAAGSAKRYAPASSVAFPITHLPNLLVPGLQGLNFKYEAYVGVITIALAFVGTRMRWKRPETKGLVVIVVLMALVTYSSAADRVLQAIPLAGNVHWDQASGFMTFGLAVLAALGLQEILSDPSHVQVRASAFVGFTCCGLILFFVFLVTELGISHAARPYFHTLILPGVQAAWGMALFAGAVSSRPILNRMWKRRSNALRAAAFSFVALETLFLVLAGVSFWSLSSTYFAPTPAVSALQKDVGSDLVGLGTCSGVGTTSRTSSEVGIRADANIGYSVHEFSVYDPILPETYYRSLESASGQKLPSSLSRLGIFCATMTSANLARLYGVQYVLEPPGAGLVGGFVHSHVGDETLYSVPYSAAAVVLPKTATAVTAGGYPLLSQQPGPSSWQLNVDAPAGALVRFHLTAVPGWHASVNGKPLPLRSWASGNMLEAEVPPGHDLVQLHYWPDLFTVGIVVGAVAAIGMAIACTVIALSRRRRGIPGVGTFTRERR
jgi:hypothetical protein